MPVFNIVEPPEAKQAYTDYLSLGPDRTIKALREHYLALRDKGQTVPATSMHLLTKWSVTYNWKGRIESIGVDESKKAEAREADFRRDTMESGYAVRENRIKSLNRLAEMLYEDLTEKGKLWLKEVRWVGGPNRSGGKVVTHARFNKEELEQFRGILDDLAKEKGERKLTMDMRFVREEAEKLAALMGLDKAELLEEAARIVEMAGFE